MTKTEERLKCLEIVRDSNMKTNKLVDNCYANLIKSIVLLGKLEDEMECKKIPVLLGGKG